MVFITVGCVSDGGLNQPSWDSRQMTVQTLSLFRQQGADGKWEGDWILRRRRLDMIDRELRQFKPDLLFLQQVMAKGGDYSPESDKRLLRAGALGGDYQWSGSVAHEHEKSHEEESMVTVVGLPANFSRPAPEVCIRGDARQCWPLGYDGWAVASVIDFEGQAVAVINVDMPEQQERIGHWYGVLRDRIDVFLDRENICPQRVIVGGFMPQDVGVGQYDIFKNGLELMDTAQEFCEQESRCYTATPLNEFYYGVYGDRRPTHTDRVLVHKSALVYSGNVSFKNSMTADEYLQSKGLHELWASDRFGWSTVVRLARCVVKTTSIPDDL
ncbi:MAG: hypothetical protein AB8C84_02695 [Oligoflexales bacterium]